MRILGRHLSYANVVATLALFVALGGSAVAAKGLINGRSIRRSTLPGDRLARHSVAGSRLKTRSITGRQVKESSLGTVPKALAADTATSAVTSGTATTADAALTAKQADRAVAADTASTADTADALAGGYGPGAFALARRAVAGVGDPTATPAPRLVDLPALGLAVDTATATSVKLVNTGTQDLTIVLPTTATLAHGASKVLTLPNGATEMQALVQGTGAQGAFIHCWFPGGSQPLTWCTGAQAG